MKRQLIDIYASIQEDSVRQNEESSEQSSQIIKKDQIGQTQTGDNLNKYIIPTNVKKKESQLKSSEFKLNLDQVKDKFSNILNSQQLVDEEVNTPQQNSQIKQNVFDSSRQSIRNKQIGEIQNLKNFGKSSFIQQYEDLQDQRMRISAQNSIYGLSNPNDNTEQRNRVYVQSSRLYSQQNQAQTLLTYNDANENKQDENKKLIQTKLNDYTNFSKTATSALFFPSKGTVHQKTQSSYSQTKSISSSASKNQLDSARGSSSHRIKSFSRGIINQPLSQMQITRQTSQGSSQRIKTQEETVQKSDGGSSMYCLTNRQTTSQNDTSQQNYVKFKRIKTEQSQKSSMDTKNMTLNDFRNVSYLNQKTKDIFNHAQMETPLLSQFEQETNTKIKNCQSLNNIYLKMLDEFQIPYEQDIEKIKQKISELKLQATDGVENINKQFIMKILLTQLDTIKVDNHKNKQLRIPTNRYDVEVLKQWLDFMIFKIYQDEFNSGQEVLEKVQSVFESCFQEIQKQVTIDCFERGDLLKKVWNNQNELYMKLIEEQQRQRLQCEQESLDEVTRVHKMYTTEVERLKQDLFTVFDEKNKLQERFIQLKHNVKYLKKNNKYVNKMVKSMKEELEYFKKKNQELLYAANQIKKGYLTLSNTQQQIQTSRKKIKSKSRISRVKIAQSSSSINELKPIALENKSSSRKSKRESSFMNSLSNLQERYNEESDYQENESDMSQDSLYKQNPYPRKSITSRRTIRGSIEGPNIQLITSEENIQTINVILEQQTQMNILQAKYTQNQMNIVDLSDEEDENELDQTTVLVNKSIDAQDWRLEFCIDETIQTDAKMSDVILKNEILRQEISTQIDQKIFKEMGNIIYDKEVQTTDLDPEYEERIKGQDLQGLEKFVDNIQKAQDQYEQAVDRVNIPFEVRKSMHNYLKFLHKNQSQMQFLLKTEIGIKEKYHKENINLKLYKKENQIIIDEYLQKIEQLKQTNQDIADENQQLDRNLVTLKRRTKKLTTNIEKFQKISSQLHTVTSKLAGNIKKSNAFNQIVSSVASGADVSLQDIENLRNKLQGNNKPGNPIIIESLTQINKTDFVNSSHQELDDQEQIDTNPQSAPVSTNRTIQKIKKAVQQLVDINIYSLKEDDLTSNSSDNDDEYNDLSKPDKSSKYSKQDDQSFQQLSMTNSQMLHSQKLKVSNSDFTKSPQSYKFNNPSNNLQQFLKLRQN